MHSINMRIFQRFHAQHGDFIHDLCYDFYGRRLASCSSDRKLKVWDLDEGGRWKLTAEWNAHQGSVWRLAWAHPEFGQVLASCSFDRTVSIWEEREGLPPGAAAERWRLQGQLVDARDSTTDIKFAPKHFGLKLATASADGFVRIYEAIDVMNLSHWPLQDEFQADKRGVTALSWNQSRFDLPMLLVGGNSDIPKVWVYNDTYRRWQVVAELLGHTDGIHDVCWAPNMGRSYHLLATASRDHTIRIWRLSRKQGQADYEAEQVACHSHHNAEVWRVQWNVTGTTLASSGDDGTVRLWRSDYEGKWVCAREICGDVGDTMMGNVCPGATVS